MFFIIQAFLPGRAYPAHLLQTFRNFRKIDYLSQQTFPLWPFGTLRHL